MISLVHFHVQSFGQRGRESSKNAYNRNSASPATASTVLSFVNLSHRNDDAAIYPASHPKASDHEDIGTNMFLSFDGIDGAGKSTQIGRLAEWLKQAGYNVTLCRDPGSTPLGERLREILLDSHGMEIHRRSEMLIYMAARAQLVEEVIRPALARQEVVISDRFLLANIVYQGYASGMDIETVRQVGRTAVADLMPDLVLVLDLPPNVALQRLDRPFDRMEARGVEYLEQVRLGFLEEAKRSPDSIEVIDATPSPESIHQACLQAIQSRLPLKKLT